MAYVKPPISSTSLDKASKEKELLAKYGIPDIDRSGMPTIGGTVGVDYASNPDWQAYNANILKQKQRQRQLLEEAMIKEGLIPTIIPEGGGPARISILGQDQVQKQFQDMNKNFQAMLGRGMQQSNQSLQSINEIVNQNLAAQKARQDAARTQLQALMSQRAAKAQAAPAANGFGGRYRQRVTGIGTGATPTSLSDILAGSAQSGNTAGNVFGMRETPLFQGISNRLPMGGIGTSGLSRGTGK